MTDPLPVVTQQDDLFRSDGSARRQLPNGNRAPMLMVQYHCPTCGYQPTLDAYAGVPTCAGTDQPEEVRIEFDDKGRDKRVYVAGRHVGVLMRAERFVGETR